MRKAWQQIHRIHRERMAVFELPVAQLTAMVANVAGGKEGGGSFAPADFQLFSERSSPHGGLPVTVAAAMLSLRHDRLLSEPLLVCWDEVLAAKDKVGRIMPATRALVSDDHQIWAIAPEWEGDGVRGLVFVDGQITGVVTLHDLDRPLLRYQFKLPPNESMGWIRAGQLLTRAT